MRWRFNRLALSCCKLKLRWKKRKPGLEVAEEEWSQFTEGEAPALGLRKPQLASALAALESAEANLAMAERNLEANHNKAPYDSVMRSKQADLGQFVGAGAQIATLFGTEVAEIRLPLSDLDVTYLNLPEESQTEPRVLLESQVSGVDAQWLGKLVRTEGVLDEASRVIYGVVQVEDPYNLKGQTHEEPFAFWSFCAGADRRPASQWGYGSPNLCNKP